MTAGELTMLCEAWFFQAGTGLLLKIIPFRKIPRMYKNPEAVPEENTLHPSTSEKTTSTATTSLRIKDAIKRTSPFTPWKNRCLIQSLAARRMLLRRGISSLLYLGVTFDKRNKMIAHAWLKTDECEMVEKNGDYVELYFF